MCDSHLPPRIVPPSLARKCLRLCVVALTAIAACSEPSGPRLDQFTGRAANAFQIKGLTRARIVGGHTDGVFAETVVDPVGTTTSGVAITSLTTWTWTNNGGEFDDWGRCQFWQHHSFAQASCRYTPPYLFGSNCQGTHHLEAHTEHYVITPEGTLDFNTDDADSCNGPYPPGSGGGYPEEGDEEYCWTEYSEVWIVYPDGTLVLHWAGIITICGIEPT